MNPKSPFLRFLRFVLNAEFYQSIIEFKLCEMVFESSFFLDLEWISMEFELELADWPFGKRNVLEMKRAFEALTIGIQPRRRIFWVVGFEFESVERKAVMLSL